MSIHSLTFGVEFELFMPAGVTGDQLAAAISGRIGKPVRAETYNHRLSNCWKIVTDGSLGDYTSGRELVSPVLTGEEGLAEVEKVCDAAIDFGCTVNKRCGLHVHVGARGLPLAFWKRAVRLYQVYEPVIDAFMPVSRRGSNNSYCRAVGGVAPATIEAATSLSQMASAMQRSTGAYDARYHKVNLTSHDRHGTIEFRQHSGTLDARKSRNWVLTCLRMVAFAKGTASLDGNGVSLPPTNMARPGTKYHRIGEMLLREQGATRQEVCDALGWPSISMPHVARSCGLDVYTQRMGRQVRYFVRRAAGTATLDTSLDGFCNLIGSEPSERDYLRLRTANLRGEIAWAA